MEMSLSKIRAAVCLLTAFSLFPTPAASEDANTGTLAKPSSSSGGWTNLFNGKDLRGWQITDFAGHGEVSVDATFKGKPAIVAEQGLALTGIHWTNAILKSNYEVELEAMKVNGSDFFCGLTLPVKETGCTFIVGGWGGAVVGISSIDGSDASENETTKFMRFEEGQWYRIRVRVTSGKIEAWIDEDKMVDLALEDRQINLRPGEIELSRPFGIAAYQTRAAWRNIRLRPFQGE
jgi:hypothetical protein